MAEWTPYASAVFRRHFGRWADDDDLQELRIIVWEATAEHDPARAGWKSFLRHRVIRRTIDRQRTFGGRDRTDLVQNVNVQTVRAGQRRQVRWELNHPDALDPAFGAVTPDFADTVALGLVLDMLPPRDRQALVDTYLVGRTCADLGAEWGLSEDRVCQIRAHAARRVAGWLRR